MKELLRTARGQIAHVILHEDTVMEQRNLEKENGMHKCPKSKSTFTVSRDYGISIDACCNRVALYYKTGFVSQNIFEENQISYTCAQRA